MFSTEIGSLAFDAKAIDRDYLVVKARSRAAGGKVKGLDVLRVVSPSAMLGEGGCIWMLLPRKGKGGATIPKDDKIVLEALQASSVADIYLARLFLREIAAMPGTTAWGLHRMGKKAGLKNGTAYEAFCFDIEERVDTGKVLTIQPRSMGEAECYYNQEKLKGLPRYSMTPDGCFNVSPEGNFFCEKFGKKNLVIPYLNIPAVEQGNLSAFYESKAGALAWLLGEGFKKISKYVPEFRLAELKGEMRRIKQPDIKAQYKAIREVLCEIIDVVDLADSGAAKSVRDALIAEGFRAEVSAQVKSGNPAVVIVRSPEAYESEDELDPYSDTKKINPWSQFVTLESLDFDQDRMAYRVSKSIAEVLGKELAIKKQVLQGDFGFLCPPEGLVFGYEERLEDRVEYHLLETFPDGKFSYKEVYDSQIFAELPSFGFDGKTTLGRDTFIYRRSDGDWWRIEDTGVHALVDVVRLKNLVAKLSSAATETVPVELISAFLRERGHEINEPVAGQIKLILEKYSEVGSIPLGEFKSARKPSIENKPKRGEELYAYIQEQTGHVLKESNRGQSSTLYDGAVGLWWDQTSGRYYVGEPDGFKGIPRACPIRQIRGTGPVGEWLRDLLMAFFVRHKQGTVRPYPFKYLDESISMSRLTDGGQQQC